MEEKIINGHIVLVPTVYIANIDSIKVNGAQIIAEKSIDFKVKTLENFGDISAHLYR